MSKGLPAGPDRYIVVVRGLVVMCSIGIRRAERDRPQRVRVSVELTATAEAGFPGEDRRRVINYEKVVAAIRRLRRPAISICARALPRGSRCACFADPRVGHVRVEVEKLDVFADAEAVGAILERARPGDPMPAPLLVGIVNITADLFSDGGRFLDPDAAVAQARALAADADIVELGAAASNVAAEPVSPAEEIRRLDPVLDALGGSFAPLAIDTCEPETQRFALARGVDYLNDIRGFPDTGLYPELAAAQCRLIVMHAVQEDGRAQLLDLAADAVWPRIEAFFAARVAALEAAGIARSRLILDPGMGFFLSTRAAASLRVLTGLGRLKQAFGLPVMVSVSRKSFLAAITGRQAPAQRGAATLAAELYAAAQGVDYIRTHDPAALRDALAVTAALETEAQRISSANL